MKSIRIFSLSLIALCYFQTAQAQPAETWKTGQVTSYAAGDDGDLETGVAWPTPRFTDNGNGTVTDNLTGLIWLKNANCAGTMTWPNALTFCNDLSSGSYGLTDGSVAGEWHLPNRKELLSLIDYSQYSPALPQGHPFTNVQSSYYWSATTYAYNSSYAWGVYMYDGYVYRYYKTYGYDVWPVRAGQCGSLDHFDISAPSLPQTVEDPFQITITAKDQCNHLLTTLNGSISLTSNNGSVYPNSVNLTNGYATVWVTLYNRGNDTRLNCSGYGAYGYSNYFDVTGDSGCSGTIGGTVRPWSDKNQTVENANVTLYDAQSQQIDTDVTDVYGQFCFLNLECGSYEVKVEKNGVIKRAQMTVVGNLTNWTNIRLPLQTASQDTPVILVAGMLGSHYDKFGLEHWPFLLEENPAPNLKLFWPSVVGWEDLDNLLCDAGFYVFDCPWDWRNTCKKNYKDYLVPKIQEALSYSTRNPPKVHIVAHSMGGLVVRAYIQNKSDNPDYQYNNDIDKFAMVGTPNLGSCDPYCMWEGGDPRFVDDIKLEIWSLTYPFYTGSLSRLWKETYGKRGWNPANHDEIRKFIRDKTQSLLQLMYTNNFLTDGGVPSWGITTPGNENTWLKELNNGSGNDYVPPGERMSVDGSGGTKVHVRVFAGESSDSTISFIKTYDRDASNFKNSRYEDGQPTNKWPDTKNVIKLAGDGTVPYDSAIWPYTDGWGELYGSPSSGKHASLVKDFAGVICDFLTGSQCTGAQPLSFQSMSSASRTFQQLTVSVSDDMRLYITDPGAQHTGIDPVSGNIVEEIPDSGCAFGSEGGSIGIESLATGSYVVNFFGESTRDFHLNVGYADDTRSEQIQLRGFCPAAPGSFSISVDSSAAPPITVNPSVQAPLGLKADPYTDVATEYTRLSWTPSGQDGVTDYNIYASNELEPYFSKITTVAVGTTSFDTTDLWSADSSTPVVAYALTEVLSNGSESFFSNIVLNDDRDHDGLSDEKEIAAGTGINDADSDDDGIQDGEEQVYGTDPLSSDTDGDGVQDGTEVGFINGHPTDTGSGFIPDEDSGTRTDPLDNDTDGDGYTDGEEDTNYNGRVDEGESDPDDSESTPTSTIPTVTNFGIIIFFAILVISAFGVTRRKKERGMV